MVKNIGYEIVPPRIEIDTKYRYIIYHNLCDEKISIPYDELCNNCDDPTSYNLLRNNSLTEHYLNKGIDRILNLGKQAWIIEPIQQFTNQDGNIERYDMIEIKDVYYTKDLQLKIDMIKGYYNSPYIYFTPNFIVNNQNVSSKYPLIFLHIPKCAGTSLCNMLQIPKDNRGHGNYSELKHRINPEIWNSHKKFTVVRNPFDRIVSTYAYRKQKKYDCQFFKKDMYGNPLEDDYTFEDWFWNLDVHLHFGMHATVHSKNLHWPSNMTSSYDLILDNNNEISIDYIARFENLNDDLKIIFDDLNLKLPEMSKQNKSKHKHYSEYFKCKTGESIKEMIYDIFKKDFDAFGYEYEEKKA